MSTHPTLDERFDALGGLATAGLYGRALERIDAVDRVTVAGTADPAPDAPHTVLVAVSGRPGQLVPTRSSSCGWIKHVPPCSASRAPSQRRHRGLTRTRPDPLTADRLVSWLVDHAAVDEHLGNEELFRLIVHKFEARGVEAELVGLNDHSHELHTGLTGRLAGSH